MELRQLEYFVAVAEEASFTRAAERVHISQSGVSAQIRQLEADLGAPLVDRSGRVAGLTPAGKAVLDHAREALAAAEAVRRAVDDVNGVVRGRLVVGMVTGCTVAPLFEALARFRSAHPGVAIRLVEDNSDVLLDGVRSGGVDVALVGAAGAPAADLGSLALLSEPLAAGVPVGHPLAGRKRVKLEALCGFPVVCLPVGTGVRAAFDDACRHRGLDPEVVLEASAPAAVAELALLGIGAAVLTPSMLAAHPGLATVVLDGLPRRAVLALVWSERESPARRAFVDLARHTFPDTTPAPDAGHRPRGAGVPSSSSWRGPAPPPVSPDAR